MHTKMNYKLQVTELVSTLTKYLENICDCDELVKFLYQYKFLVFYEEKDTKVMR